MQHRLIDDRYTTCCFCLAKKSKDHARSIRFHCTPARCLPGIYRRPCLWVSAIDLFIRWGEAGGCQEGEPLGDGGEQPQRHSSTAPGRATINTHWEPGQRWMHIAQLDYSACLDLVPLTLQNYTDIRRASTAPIMGSITAGLSSLTSLDLPREVHL